MEVYSRAAERIKAAGKVWKVLEAASKEDYRTAERTD